MSEGKFNDLAARLASAAVLAVIGLGAVWAGGVWLLALVALGAALMVWELVSMLAPAAPGSALLLAAGAAAAVIAARLLPAELALPVLCLPGLAGLGLLPRYRLLYLAYTLLILTACFSLLVQRMDFGLVWIAWLIAVVITTDVAGYFAGRLIGGPKFWPRVSPKKTWSGTAAGWLGAGLVGLAFIGPAGAGAVLVLASVFLAMASQAGDVVESAIKCKMRVKDASKLIPGHGGLLDRFDGLIGAAVALLVLERLAGFAPGALP